MKSIVIQLEKPSTYLDEFAEYFPSYDRDFKSESMKDVKNVIAELFLVDDKEVLFCANFLYDACLERSKYRKNIFIHGYQFFDTLKKHPYEAKKLLRVADVYEIGLILEPHEISKLSYSNGEITKTHPLTFGNKFELFNAIHHLDSGTIKQLREVVLC